ncbi:MAG: ABC-2 family transporter protein [Dermatophilaceae bacterium]
MPRSPHAAVLRSRVRAQASYPIPFAVDLAAVFVIGVLEFAEVWVLFHRTGVLGGLDIRGILLVFGLAEFAFSLADLVAGHLDRLPTYLRAGTLEVFYLRPQPILLQLMSSEIALKRLARVVFGMGAIVVAVRINPIDWTVDRVAVLALTLACAPVLYGALFVLAAGLQFFLLDGREFTNAFVYGGRYAATQPASIWPQSLVAGFAFVIPVAFTAYLPTLWLLGLPGGGWLPAELAWALPLATLWTVALAGVGWRTGIRHYQGGGG